jgi:hypothetical protein
MTKEPAGLTSDSNLYLRSAIISVNTHSLFPELANCEKYISVQRFRQFSIWAKMHRFILHVAGKYLVSITIVGICTTAPLSLVSECSYSDR